MVKRIKEELFEREISEFEALNIKFNPFKPDPLSGSPGLFIGRERERKAFAISLKSSSNMMIIGDVGMGKTSLCTLAHMAYADDYAFCFADWNVKSPRQTLLTLLLDCIQRNYYTTIPKEISEMLVKIESFRYSPISYPTVEIIRNLETVCVISGMDGVIVIDNFYNFEHTKAFFDAYLCSLTANSHIASVICITLPRSVERLMEESPSLYQRLSTCIELNKFSQEEIREIIEKRIESVRIKEMKNIYHPFTEEAMDVIVENADGNAREAIRFAHEAINNATMDGIKIIDKDFMLRNIVKLKKTLVQRFLQKYGERGEKIIKYLIENDGKLRTKELGIKLNMKSSGHIAYYLNQLIEDGLIERIDKGRYKVNLEEDFKKEFKNI